jgi:REP element-mobilizing transposase RayT
MKKQLTLNLYSGKNGGRRPNSGRPRIHSKGVSHSKREPVTSRTPLKINFKKKTYIRTEKLLDIINRSIEHAKLKNLHIICFTIQSNHIHLIAETQNNKTLSSGMRSVTNTIAKNLKKGSMQIERYHLHVLRNPTEVRNAISYVMTNDLKHTGKMNMKFTKKLTTGKSWLMKSIF